MNVFSDAPVARRPWSRALIAALLLLPPVVYLALVVGTTLNVPYRDDFNWYLRLFTEFDSAPSLAERLTLLLRQHDQHRQVPLKASAVLSTYALGRLDMRVLHFVGNASLVATYLFWLWRFRRGGLPGWSLLPIGFLWFQPQYWLNVVDGSLANFPVNFFATLTLVLLNRRDRRSFVAAAVLSILTTVSNGNGMFVYICGAFLLLVNAAPRRLLGWLLLAAGTMTWYFTFDNYYFSGHAGDTSVASKLIGGLHLVLVFLWTYLGSFVIFDRTLVASVAALVLGVLISVPFVVSLGRTLVPALQTLVRGSWHWRTSPAPDAPGLALLKVVQAMFIFNLLTGVAVYLFRSDLAPFPDLPLYDYYKINPVLAAGFSLVMAYLLWQPRLVPMLAVWAGSLVFWAASYLHYTEPIFSIRRSLRAEALNWHLNGRWLLHGPIGMFDHAFANRYTRELLTRDRYHVPTGRLPELRALLSPAGPSGPSVALRVERAPDGYWLHSTEALPPALVGTQQGYLVLRRDSSTFLFPLEPHRLDWRGTLRQQALYAPAFAVKIPDSATEFVLPAGTYDATLVTLDRPARWAVPGRWRADGTTSGLVPQ
jgi:hypothetical protein